MPDNKGAFAKIKKRYEEIYIMNDPFVIKTLYAHYISFQIDSDPVWLVVTGASGGLKSALLGSLATCKYVHPLSTITANTFISGAKLVGGKPASLLHKLSEKNPEMKGSGIISFKDLTSLMSEPDITKALLMGQLREIYDGRYDKQFGTGQSIKWKGKVTVIAGSTPSIHRMRQQYSAMGERFMFYDLTQPDRNDAGMKSLNNSESGEITANREELAELSRVYLNETIDISIEIPPVSKELKIKMVALAELATRARSNVVRDYRTPNKDIVEVDAPEMPTRFSACLITMVRALMIINWNEIGEMVLLEEDYKIIDKITLDSITPTRRKVMQELSKYTILETAGLSLKLDMPISSLTRSLEDLTALGIAKKEKGANNKNRWFILPQYRDLIRQSEGIENTGTELTEQSVENAEELLEEAESIRQEELKPEEMF